MKRIWVLLLLPVFLKGQTLKDWIDLEVRAAAAQGFSGVVLAADHGQPLYFRSVGFRDFARKTPLHRKDLFELASVSKAFTAMIIMMLKEKKQLDYDDPVSRYLKIPYPHITIRHLLNHTSGLPDYQAIMDAHWDKSRAASNQDILEYLNHYAPPRLFEPGTGYEYSNTGYVLLASIAEKISGQDFIALCRKWIFRPLKMKQTDIRSLSEKKQLAHFAVGHIYVPETGEYLSADSFPSSNYTIWLGNRKGPGRVSSTASDLLRWDQALNGTQLIGQQTLQEAFLPARLQNGSTSYYGFGWMLYAEDQGKPGRVYHTGDNPGYSTKIVRLIDKQRTLIILCNNAFSGFDALASHLEKLLNQ